MPDPRQSVTFNDSLWTLSNQGWVTTGTTVNHLQNGTAVSSGSTLSADQLTAVHEAETERLKEYAKEAKKRETRKLKQYLQSGVTGDFTALANKRGIVSVFSRRSIANYSWIFSLTKHGVIAEKKRTTHIKAVLQKLADSEGLKLIFADKPPKLGKSKEVLYYPFKTIVDVDDTLSVTVTKPRITNEVEHYADDCDCDDCVHEQLQARAEFIDPLDSLPF